MEDTANSAAAIYDECITIWLGVQNICVRGALQKRNKPGGGP